MEKRPSPSLAWGSYTGRPLAAGNCVFLLFVNDCVVQREIMWGALSPVLKQGTYLLYIPSVLLNINLFAAF